MGSGQWAEPRNGQRASSTSSAASALTTVVPGDASRSMAGSTNLGQLELERERSRTVSVDELMILHQLEDTMASARPPPGRWPWRMDSKIKFMCEGLGISCVCGKGSMMGNHQLVDFAVRSAAKTGNVAILRWLQEGGLWDPRRHVDVRMAIDAADSGDKLLDFLGAFDVRIKRNLAEAYFEKLSEELASLSDMKRGGQELLEGHYAQLVANFIKVKTKVADDVMEEIVLTRQLLLKRDDQEVVVMPTEMNFPHHLGTIYVTRKAAYNKKSLTFTPSKDALSKTIGGQLMLHGEDVALRVSALSPVTFKSSEKRWQALIPTDAKEFAYVYNGEWLETGGFLYLDVDSEGSRHPISVNPISFRRGTNALQFAPAEDVEGGDCTLREKDWEEITVEGLLACGATHYMWVVPGEKGLVLRTDDRQAISASTDFGGYAYKLKIEEAPGFRVAFFPVKGAGELVDRGVVGWEMNALEIRDKRNRAAQSALQGLAGFGRSGSRHDSKQSVASVSDRCDDEEERSRKLGELEHVISNTWWIHEWTSFVSSRDTERFVEHTREVGQAVKFARLTIPGAMNPNLLQAIAIAQRSSVLETTAAKAIVCAAFGRIFPALLRDMIGELFVYGLFWLVILEMRWPCHADKHLLHEIACRPGAVMTYLVLLTLYAFRTFVSEAVLLREHIARGWMGSYFSISRFLGILNGILTAVVVKGALTYGGDTTRIIVAWSAALRLCKALNFLRAFETASLGLRIAPILESLTQSVNFLFIVFCCLLVYTTAFYGMTDNVEVTLLEAFESVYRIGLLADFDMTSDVQTSAEAVTRGWEYVAFVFITLSVSVAMMNIFIGMFTSYYDHYQDRVAELFVRVRAQFCVTYMLSHCGMARLMGSRKPFEDSRDCKIWLCYKDAEDEEDDSESGDVSIRSAVKAAMSAEAGRLERHLFDLGRRVDLMQATLSGRPGTAGGPGTSTAVSSHRRKPTAAPPG